MSMKKISELQLETTANYQAKSRLNVRFWNQDLNTAELKFLITRDNFPLSLSNENVVIIIAMQQGKNFISSDEFVISSEIDGVCSFMIPDDFLSRVNGEVEAQIYVGTKDNDQVVVQRPFTFQVENDLLSTIPSELKLQYIKTFSDLRQDVQDRITALENEFVVMEDYVVAVNQATTDGLNALNNLVNAKTIEYNDNHANKLALINTTVDGYVQDFLDQRNYIDTKYTEFQTAVGESGLVTVGDAESWQKYKLTQDDGTRTYLPKGSFEDVNALEPGYYETVSNDTPTQGFPLEFANAAFIEIDVTKSSSESGRKQIQVTQSSRPQTFVKYIHTGGVDDNGWKEIPYVNAADPFETVNSSQSKANTAENNAKVYTDTKLAATRSTLFSGSVNGVNQNINLTESMDNYSILIVSGTYTGGTFNETFLVSTIGNGIPIQRINLSNVTGGSPNVFEMELTRVNSTRFKIIRDNQYSILGENATMDVNNFTVKRIEAIK